MMKEEEVYAKYFAEQLAVDDCRGCAHKWAIFWVWLLDDQSEAGVFYADPKHEELRTLIIRVEKCEMELRHLNCP